MVRASRNGRAAAFAAAALALLPLTVSAHAHEGVGFHIPHEERATNAPYLAELKRRYGEAPARVTDTERMFAKRQTVSGASSSHASSTVAAGSAPTSASVTMGTIPIGTTTTPETTSPLPTTYSPGATAPVSGAPTLPNVVIDPSQWPALDKVPPTNSSQVQQWISAINWSQVPNIPVNQLGGCQNTSNAQAVTYAATNGWWTCGWHTRSSDIVSCPKKNTWGLSYDDGPSPDTPRLLNYLVENNLKSTFFIVGSRAISRPQMLQYEYMAGNQLAVHTWSHPYLTTKTNEEIVAELGWTKAAIKAITGVTPLYMRPPYGDIDDRVRAICLQMNLTPIIWTVVNGTSYDSFDWEVAGGVVNADQVVSKFEAIINNASSLDTGFIVLEHDLYQQSTSLAVDWVLPFAKAKTSLTLEPIYQCLGQNLADTYAETASNTSSSAAAATTLDRSSEAQTTAGAAQAAAAATAGQKGAAGHVVVPALTGLAALALALAF